MNWMVKIYFGANTQFPHGGTVSEGPYKWMMTMSREEWDENLTMWSSLAFWIANRKRLENEKEHSRILHRVLCYS